MRKLIKSIEPLDKAAMNSCLERLNNLTKPVGSLGALEEMAVKLAGITGSRRPENLKKSIILMAADHGVVAEGVSAYPQAVTAQMVLNFCRGGAAVNILAKHAGANLVLVDVGVAAVLPELEHIKNKKIAFGTANMAKGPAMSIEQAIAAICAGIEVVREELNKGVRVIGLGEMGIGNTTASTAIICCFSGRSADEITGSGTGISTAARFHKAEVIEMALAVNKPDKADPLAVLAKVGGLEIAGLVGVILGAAAGKAAVVVDGVNAAAAALVAVKLAPNVKDYLIGSHYSVEVAQQAALDIIGIPAYLKLDMRLGEATGAALGMTIIDAALAVLNGMHTFAEAQVSAAHNVIPPEQLHQLSGDTKQALVVAPAGKGCTAFMTAWENVDNHWQVFGSRVAVTIGRGGFADPARKIEGDGCTPTGVYYLGLTFGSDPASETSMPYRKTTSEDCWVDDPNSTQYNCWVEGKPLAGSWEELLRPDGLYRYGIVVEYNTNPVIAGKGSAIFIHLWKAPGEPTAGCVAMEEDDLRRIMAWLSPEKKPVIVLGVG